MSADRGTKVLVIDDEKGLRDMLAYTLARMGYQVRSAESGERGVSLARVEPFDAVICDLMMPGMDGIAVLEILKRELPGLEVIMATGFPTIETNEKAAALGAFAYLAKPYDLMAVVSLLERAVARKRSANHGG